MNKAEIEKSLKRFLKRKVGYSFALLVAFMISGEISLAVEENNQLNAQKVAEKEEPKDVIELIKRLGKKEVVQTSKDKSTQFFFNVWLEQRKAKKYADNGFSKIVDDWENQIKPDIDIPDIRDTANPSVPENINPLPNEDSIVKVPEFEFDGVKDFIVADAPEGINISVEEPKVPVKEIGSNDFGVIDENNIADPGAIGDLGTVSQPTLGAETSPKIDKPTAPSVGDIAMFIPPEIKDIAPKNIDTPISITMSEVKISADGFNQSAEENIYINYLGANEENSDHPIVLENYDNYEVDGESFGIYFNEHFIHYDKGKIKVDSDGSWGYNPSTLGLGDGLRNKFLENTKVATFISDVEGKDVNISGIYNMKYEGSRGTGANDDYIRMFLSSNPAGVATGEYESNSSQTIKNTNFNGILNLSTSEDGEKKVGGNLIGLEHQTWDRALYGEKPKKEDYPLMEWLYEIRLKEWNEWNNAFKSSYSVLINSGTINLGARLENANSELKIDSNSKNMIGIMVDLEQSSGTKFERDHNNETINAGEINIYGMNSIGFSFEEYRNTENTKEGYFILRDDAYIGKINVEGKQNYGFKMGNIFSENLDDEGGRNKEGYLTYFDKTNVIGNIVGNEIIIKNDDGTNSSEKYAYTSNISVGGTQNIGMVVGKSLSDHAADYINGSVPVNPIANFKNISITVEGDQTIGFLRDKDYSENNKNDMIVNEKSLTTLKFDTKASNSVLLRSEQYGITLAEGKTLDVSGAGSNVDEQIKEKGFYNIAMQGTRQSWDKNGKDINSSGNVTNKGIITGTVSNMVGMMSSGKLTASVIDWQNGDERGEAEAVNSGTISLTGDNNIGMTALDGNIGKLTETGKITITGAEGVGVYNRDNGHFTGEMGSITVTGKNAVGIYNIDDSNDNVNSTVTLKGTTISVADNSNAQDSSGAVGIYSEGGSIIFDNNDTTKIIGGENSSAGIYAKGTVGISGKVQISNTKTGIVAEEGTTSITNGNIIYNGDSFALYAKEAKDGKQAGSITFDQASSLTLKGNAYGFNVDENRQGNDKAIDFGGATINAYSNDVTIFNIDGKNKFTISAGSSKLPGAESLAEYVGNVIINNKEIIDNADGSKTEKTYDGYKIASIDGGIINLDGLGNKTFLEKYKFQKSIVNVTKNIDMTIDSTEAGTYFNGQVVGIGQSSSQNIDTTATDGADQRAETKINITGTDTAKITVTADRTDDKSDGKSTIGAYISYGEIHLANGNIEVETGNNTVNNNGVGIYAKNGSLITTDEKSSIIVNGDDAVGIYAEATEDTDNNKKNEFGGDITTLEITNAGNITLTGKGGVGIFADNTDNTAKAAVSNSGTIKVGAEGNGEKSNAGIYGINTNISNTGTIEIGYKHEHAAGETHSGSIGIYAENSDVQKIGTVKLGSYATGVYITGNSTLTNADNVVFADLDKQAGDTNDTTDRIGIRLADVKNADGSKATVNIGFGIDMSNVDGGKAVVAENTDITLAQGKTITVSGYDGKGIRVIDGTVTNNGTITIAGDSNPDSKSISVGILAMDTNGKVDNKGTINVESANGVGIYVDNTGDKQSGNSIINVGTINLTADNTKGIVAKDTAVDLGTGTVNIGTITNDKNEKSGMVGIYATGNSTVTNGNITVVGTADNLDAKNIGVYLADGATYSGTINVSNGAIGLYADNVTSELSGLNIISDSKGVQTIGAVLKGNTAKNVAGNVTLKNSNNGKVEGRNIGIYAEGTTVNVKEQLAINYDESNGTGIYLKGSVLSGEGTINITGQPKKKTDGTYSNSVGIYYAGTDKAIAADNTVNININKSHTIGVYAKGNDKSSISLAKGGTINIGSLDTGTETINKVESITALTAGEYASITNTGTINLNKVDKGIGMAALKGTVNNSGNITISSQAESGTGVFVTDGGTFNGENGTIAINGEAADTHLGIGIYVLENGTVKNTGKFDLEKGNIAVYADKASLNTDINMINESKNSGTIALAAKSGGTDTTKTTVGGTDTDKMKVTLAESSTGIYAMDSGVQIKNVIVDAKAHSKDSDDLSYGIYLKEDAGKSYTVANTEVEIVKGVGIALGNTVSNTSTKLELSGSNITVNSYTGEIDKDGKATETGIAVYAGEGNTITLTGGNTLNLSNATGIYGAKDSLINVGATTNTSTDTINLQGYSVGLYSQEGKIELGNNTNITFEKMENTVETNTAVKGAVAYTNSGVIISSANITGTEKDNLEDFTGLLAQNGTITNKGTIDLSGSRVAGISVRGGTAANEGTINVYDVKVTDSTVNQLSAGIYSDGGDVTNAGTINIKGGSAGVVYVNTDTNNATGADLATGIINVTGTRNIGVSLSGTAHNVTTGAIDGTNQTGNLGVYLKDFEANQIDIGNIILGADSAGLYVTDSTSAVINSIGNVNVGNGGIGVAADNSTNLTLSLGQNKITVGEKGTGIYVGENSTVNLNSMQNVWVGKGGAFLHVNGGSMILGSANDNITIDGNIGMVLENGGTVTSKDGSKVETMIIVNGGIGIVAKEGGGRPEIFGDGSKIIFGKSDADNTDYSVGIYYQDAGDRGNLNKANIAYEDGTHHTIGTIFDETYGTLTNSKIEIGENVSDSIGVIVRRELEKDEAVPMTGEVIFKAGNDNVLINVTGKDNIGIIGRDSVIKTTGDISVGGTGIGVYLTGGKEEVKLAHSYTGNGNISATDSGMGIYAKNYDITQNGNISISGTDTIGIAGMITDGHDEKHRIDYTGNISISGADTTGAKGIYGKGVDIDAKGNITLSDGRKNFGIISLNEGQIDYNGDITIDDVASIGIYKSTEKAQGKLDEKVNITGGAWSISNGSIGLDVRAKAGDTITVENKASISTDNGAVGIYSAGKNTINNYGNLNVNGTITDEEATDINSSMGIYMANGTGTDGNAIGTNYADITVTGNSAYGVRAAGYVDFINDSQGTINVSEGGVGMASTQTAKVINKGKIIVENAGIGMVADGKENAIASEAINYGNITLNGDTDAELGTLVGMAAYNGGHIINETGATITVNAGIGMYVDEQSKYTNRGHIEVNSGIGFAGYGQFKNEGTIEISSGAEGSLDLSKEENIKAGSMVIDNVNKIIEFNDNFTNSGNIEALDFSLKLNDTNIDVTAIDNIGFAGKDVYGNFNITSNILLDGNGISWFKEGFVDSGIDVTVNDGNMVDFELDPDGNLIGSKKPYKDITVGDQFDARDNAFDEIIAAGGKDAEILKQLNYYLNNIKNDVNFHSEAERTLGELGGNVYANIQSRMQDINRTFDNSFDEMVSSYNPKSVNDKFSLLYTNGDYENDNSQLVDYEYSITGLNYMREYEKADTGIKYGADFGFAVSKFEFDDSGSEEDVYSLRAGVHRVQSFNNDITLTSRVELGYNRHETERKMNLGSSAGIIESDEEFNSYSVSLDNKVRKPIFKSDNNEIGAFAGLNLEYGRFDDIKENGLANLEVKANDYISSKAFVGLDAENTQYLSNDWAAKLTGDIRYSYDFGNNYDENEAKINSGDYYSLMSEVESEGAVTGKVGVTFEKSDYMAVTFEGEYTEDFERDEQYWRAGLRFTYKFNTDDTISALRNPMGFLENRFAFDKDSLTQEEKENIVKTTEFINKRNVKGTIIIDGHADSTGKENYNQTLSEKRAKNVENEFKKNIKKAGNIQYDVKGYGETKPAADNNTPEGRAANRRTDVKFIDKR